MPRRRSSCGRAWRFARSTRVEKVMADARDPFDVLRRPVAPLAPRPEFVTSLFRKLREELGMTSTVEPQDTESSDVVHGSLAMVHLRVLDADRAMRFFGSLFAW